MYQELHPSFLEAMDRLEVLAQTVGGLDALSETEEGRELIAQALRHAPPGLNDMGRQQRIHQRR